MEKNYLVDGAIAMDFITLYKGKPKALSMAFAVSKNGKVMERVCVTVPEITINKENITVKGNPFKTLLNFVQRVHSLRDIYGIHVRNILMWNTKTLQIWRAILRKLQPSTWSRAVKLPSALVHFMADFTIASVIKQKRLKSVFELAKKYGFTKAKYSMPSIDVGLINKVYNMFRVGNILSSSYTRRYIMQAV